MQEMRWLLLWTGFLSCSLATASNDPCVACHRAQVEGFARTGMANSFGKPVGQPAGTLRHSRSQSSIKIVSSNEGMRHRLEQGGLAADYGVDYFIGSGNKGRSYVVNVKGRLFQSPASFYADRKRWDVSPGYESESELDFDRPVTTECLFCHSGQARPVPSTLNTYETPPFSQEAITCERCHGDSQRHLAQPSAGNIINPVKLKPELRAAICNQCHLGGEARIPNPGRHFWDYKPGQPLEDVFSVYVSAARGVTNEQPLKVVSHSEQLASSKCAQQSGSRMWCGTCHDPHQKPIQSATWYTERCLDCHSRQSLATHKGPLHDCAGCHMPQRKTYDGGHTPFTDHEILAKPRRSTSAGSAPESLRAWREPPGALTIRNLGLAYISVGERYQSARHLNEGFRLLSEIQFEFARDPAVLTSLGALLQKKGRPKEAAEMFSRTTRLEPRNASFHLNLAVALSQAGEGIRAIETLETAISLDPSLRDAYLLLAEVYAGRRQRDESREALRRYLRFTPLSILFRRKLAHD